MKGILERVTVGEPDSWCSRMVIQEKRNGKARRTVDLSHLSKQGLEKSHTTSSLASITMRIPGKKLKSKLECVDRYHGIELEEADRHKNTFAKEWGKFWYRRAQRYICHQGIVTADTLTQSWRIAHPHYRIETLRR